MYEFSFRPSSSEIAPKDFVKYLGGNTTPEHKKNSGAILSGDALPLTTFTNCTPHLPMLVRFWPGESSIKITINSRKSLHLISPGDRPWIEHTHS